MAAPRLFGTNGIRGVVGDRLTPEFTLEIGLAMGRYLSMGSKVLVGCDTRTSNHMFTQAMVSGLLASGCHVIEAGVLPTPTLQYAVPRVGADLGVVLTASHNPPDWNGIKAIDSKATALTIAAVMHIGDSLNNTFAGKPVAGGVHGAEYGASIDNLALTVRIIQSSDISHYLASRIKDYSSTTASSDSGSDITRGASSEVSIASFSRQMSSGRDARLKSSATSASLKPLTSTLSFIRL